MSQTYQVVLKGPKAGLALERVAEDLSLLFKVPSEQARGLLARPHVVVKRAINLQTDARYQTALEQRGCVCLVEPEALGQGTSPIDPANPQLAGGIHQPIVLSIPPGTEAVAKRLSKYAVAIIIVVGVMLACAYYASPYVALHEMQAAARAGEGDRLARHVDFPAVRESLKSQMQAMLTKRMLREDLKDNPFAAFGMLLAGSMVGMMVDNMVTTESLASIVNSGKPKPPAGEDVSSVDQPTNSHSSNDTSKPPRITRYYEGLGVFKVEMHDAETDKLMLTLVFNRDGWFGWRLKAIRMDVLT